MFSNGVSDKFWIVVVVSVADQDKSKSARMWAKQFKTILMHFQIQRP